MLSQLKGRASVRRKTTTTDIANRLGLSRTTVSKALNGHPSIPEATLHKVRETAIGLGYKKMLGESAGSPDHPVPSGGAPMRSIALLIRSTITVTNEGYWVDVMRGAEEASRQSGCNLLLHFITQEDVDDKRLPRSLTDGAVDGVLLAGLTHQPFVQAALATKLPTVLIDSYPDMRAADHPCDTVLMESEQSVHVLTEHLIGLGHERIGFIGDIADCLSFTERWNGYRRALLDAALPIDLDTCAIAPAAKHYFDTADITEALRAMHRLPTAFVCANDLVARRTVRALEAFGLRVPEDISVTGFDRMDVRGETPAGPQALTTVKVNAGHIGLRACEQLLWRMDRPSLPANHIRIATSFVLGESTTAARRT
jgi:LacI family transcriptional regulator